MQTKWTNEKNEIGPLQHDFDDLAVQYKILLAWAQRVMYAYEYQTVDELHDALGDVPKAVRNG